MIWATCAADGRLVIAGGRLRDMIIRGGENIYPAEIENVLQQHEAVAEVAVFGVPDDYYGEIVAAAVKLSRPVPASDLQALCASRIAKFKVPAVIFTVERFPLTPSGKIRKVELRQWAKREPHGEAGMTGLTFWFDVHSPWVYLASFRIGDIARKHGLAPALAAAASADACWTRSAG